MAELIERERKPIPRMRITIETFGSRGQPIAKREVTKYFFRRLHYWQDEGEIVEAVINSADEVVEETNKYMQEQYL